MAEAPVNTRALSVDGPIQALRNGVGFELYYIGNGQREGIVMRRAVTDAAQPPLVRIHNSCLFSESLDISECDCAMQLRKALDLIAEQGGLLAYAYNEGRGAGLRNKVRAIAVQQAQGVDTATAFRMLSLPIDPRDYELEIAALKHFLAEPTVRLLSNNPARVEKLEASGISVRERVGLVCAHPEIADYLNAKRRVLGHILD